jgi:hypothetical protein
MIETGWTAAPDELPVSAHLRSVAEILAAPLTAAERRQARRELDEQDERRAQVRDVADAAESVAFRARVNGYQLHGTADVLAGVRDGLDREQHERRRAAARVLREHGLADVLGVPSGTVFDANLGALEPPQDERARAAMDREYEHGRALREAEARTRAVAAMRLRLEDRWRAR